MAFIWNGEPTGTLRVQFSGSSSTKNFVGINTNVLSSSPGYAVLQVNKLLDVGEVSAVVNTSTRFTEISGVIDNE